MRNCFVNYFFAGRPQRCQGVCEDKHETKETRGWRLNDDASLPFQKGRKMLASPSRTERQFEDSKRQLTLINEAQLLAWDIGIHWTWSADQDHGVLSWGWQLLLNEGLCLGANRVFPFFPWLAIHSVVHLLESKCLLLIPGFSRTGVLDSDHCCWARIPSRISVALKHYGLLLCYLNILWLLQWRAWGRAGCWNTVSMRRPTALPPRLLLKASFTHMGCLLFHSLNLFGSHWESLLACALLCIDA